MPDLTPAKIVSHYEDGILTKMETLLRLVSALTPTNVSGALDALSTEWQADLRAEAESAPTDDWSGFRIVSPGAYVNVTAEQFEQMERDSIAAYRSGIATLRAYFGGNG